jgi:dipeptide/tripeptide permease
MDSAPPFVCRFCLPWWRIQANPRPGDGSVAFFYGAFDFGVISAGITLGFLADLVGFRGIFQIAAGLGLASAIFFMLAIQPLVASAVRLTLTGR